MANTQQRVTNITANATPTPALNVSEYRTLVVDVSGTFVATVQVQSSINGTSWRNVTGSTSIINLSTGAYLTSGNINAAGIYAIDISSFQYVRLISTAYTSGTMVLEYNTVTTGNLNPAGTNSTVSGTVTANQGTLATGTAISVTTTASTNASVQKSTSGNLFEITASNPTATAAYLKFYNKALDASPRVGKRAGRRRDHGRRVPSFEPAAAGAARSGTPFPAGRHGGFRRCRGAPGGRRAPAGHRSRRRELP